MRAIMVCVDFHDVLSLTLSRQVNHFHSLHIITDRKHHADTYAVCEPFPNVQVLQTDLFYADGAHFAKYRALEWALDQIGRHGWLTILDADIVYPAFADMSRYLRRGYLYTPLRRICDPIPQVIPEESVWGTYPIHPQFREWAGYSQTFHCEDARLGQPPWHQIDWTGCQGGDSFLQAKWPTEYKIRPPFEVLHLGRPGVNWLGRATPYMDGTSPPESIQRIITVRNMIRSRTSGPGRFDHEKIQIGQERSGSSSEASDESEAG